MALPTSRSGYGAYPSDQPSVLDEFLSGLAQNTSFSNRGVETPIFDDPLQFSDVLSGASSTAIKGKTPPATSPSGQQIHSDFDTPGTQNEYLDRWKDPAYKEFLRQGAQDAANSASAAKQPTASVPEDPKSYVRATIGGKTYDYSGGRAGGAPTQAPSAFGQNIQQVKNPGTTFMPNLTDEGAQRDLRNKIQTAQLNTQLKYANLSPQEVAELKGLERRGASVPAQEFDILTQVARASAIQQARMKPGLTKEQFDAEVRAAEAAYIKQFLPDVLGRNNNLGFDAGIPTTPVQ